MSGTTKIKIQLVDRVLEEDEWTDGRWAHPKEETYKDIVNPEFDIIAFPITPYKKPKRKFKKKKCLICGREYTPNNSRNTMCMFCFTIHICKGCGKVFITQNSFNKEDKNDHFCSQECSKKYACKCMDEWYKEHPKQRSKNIKKSHQENDGIKYCKKCKMLTYHLIGVGCLTCHNKSESKRESSRINMLKLWEDKEFRDNSWSERHCETCGKTTKHRFFTCLECNPEAFGGIKLSLVEENTNCNIHKDCNLMFYDKEKKKYVCWECYKDEFENKEIKSIDINVNDNKNNVKIIKKCRCKQCDKLIKDPLNDIFCSDKCEEQYKKDRFRQFKHNNKGKCLNHPNEDMSFKGKCWSCVKEEAIENRIDNINFNFSSNLIEFTQQIQQDYPNNAIFIQPTFRTQDSKDWSGSKLAFEQSLIDKNITYFVYVKFYVENNNKSRDKRNDYNVSYNFDSCPLVVGKSASMLKNINGSDVNFSTNIKDGPARRFLFESSGLYSWDKTRVLIVACKSEQEAFKIEKEIHDKYKLFYS